MEKADNPITVTIIPRLGKSFIMNKILIILRWILVIPSPIIGYAAGILIFEVGFNVTIAATGWTRDGFIYSLQAYSIAPVFAGFLAIYLPVLLAPSHKFIVASISLFIISIWMIDATISSDVSAKWVLFVFTELAATMTFAKVWIKKKHNEQTLQEKLPLQ